MMLPRLNARVTMVMLGLLVFSKWDAAGQESPQPHVVIISIDGFPASALWDERIPLPTLRELAREGVWARAMIPATPSVTWPNHTTFVTGVHPAKHGVLRNGRFVRHGPGEPITLESDLDREAMTSYPSLYDAADAAGLRTAEVNWPVTRKAGTLHDSFPDAPGAVLHTTEPLRSELAELGVVEDDEAFGRMSYAGRDHVWTSAARHLIRSRRPHLLLFHLLATDGLQHAYGTGSQPAFAALALADGYVEDVLEALEEAGIREETTIFVVSDHGFMNVTRQVMPNVVLRREGLVTIDAEGRIATARVHALSNGGTAMLFATDPETSAEDLERARRALEGAEGIARVLGPADFPVYGLPDPAASDQVGDLVLAAAEGYSFGNDVEGEAVVALDAPRGVHGYLNDTPAMRALFIASGRGVQSGVELNEVDNRAVAPAAARLLGLSLETADGEVPAGLLE